MLHWLRSRFSGPWAKELKHTQDSIEHATVEGFGVPHFVVDNVLEPSLLDRVNSNWPSSAAFSPEVPGNFIFQMYRDQYGKMTSGELAF